MTDMEHLRELWRSALKYIYRDIVNKSITKNTYTDTQILNDNTQPISINKNILQIATTLD